MEAREHTHYSYVHGPDGKRKPTSLYDLREATPAARRKLIHHLAKNTDGEEHLAECPFGVKIKDMRELRQVLAALDEEDIARCKFCQEKFRKNAPDQKYCSPFCQDLDAADDREPPETD